MMPLSHVLKKYTHGYKLRKSQEMINHLIQIDDIKLSAKNEKELETLIQAVRIYSGDIEMELGIVKCHVINEKRKTTNDRRNRTTKVRQN